MDSKLSGLLKNRYSDLKTAWDNTEAAEDFAPLPPGEYVCRIVGGELVASRNDTPGFKITFQILEGEHTGRKIWHDIWLTESALPMAKRDLQKLGVTDLDQLNNPIPAGIRCNVYGTGDCSAVKGAGYTHCRQRVSRRPGPANIFLVAVRVIQDSQTLGTCLRYAVVNKGLPDGVYSVSVCSSAISSNV